jgi:hypothetical protein
MFEAFRRSPARGIVALVAVASVVAPAAAALSARPAAAAPRVAALSAASTGPARAVQGSDGKVHLDYDLVLTSMFDAPVTLVSVDVLAPSGRRLLRLEGDALAAVTHSNFGALDQPTSTVPPSGTVGTELDVVVAPGDVPGRLHHRIRYSLPADAPNRTLIGTDTVRGPRVEVERDAAVPIDSPLRGPGWADLNGCCDTSAHRYMRASADGRLVKPETFAIDWMQVRDGKLYDGDGTQNDQYFGEGAPIHAVADGTIVSVIDGLAETAPFGAADLRDTEDYGGNTVVQRIRPGVYAYYAHFQPGTIRVKAGDRVHSGDVLGRLGSSGNSTNPHLHFQLQRGPGVLTSDSLPFEIRRYTVTGTVRDISFPNVEISAVDRRQRRTLPLIGSIADFG